MEGHIIKLVSMQDDQKLHGDGAKTAEADLCHAGQSRMNGSVMWD